MKSISTIIASYNDAKLLNKCLKSIRDQDYDQSKIEIIVADGGSKDNTREIVKKYKGKLFIENSLSPESAKSFALLKAHNDIILQVDCDNVLPNNQWLKNMMSALEKEPKAVGCYTWRYTYQKDHKYLNRYFSLFGVNDPVAYFLNKADRQSYHSSEWHLNGKIKDKGGYFLAEFNCYNMPTLGANGFLIKRTFLKKAKIDRDNFYHIDVNWDLINQGFNKYTVVKNDIIHQSGDSILKFFQKRKRYMQDLYLRDFTKRRFFLYDKDRDKFKIILFSLYSLTLIFPFIDSLRGYFKIRDIAWFLHPIICFVIFWIYFYSTIKNYLKLI